MSGIYKLSADGFALSGDYICIECQPASSPFAGSHDVFVQPWKAVPVARALRLDPKYSSVRINIGRLCFVEPDGSVNIPPAPYYPEEEELLKTMQLLD